MNKDGFVFLYHLVYLLYYFLVNGIPLARMSSMMLKRRGKRGYLLFFPNLSEKASSFSPLSMMLAEGLVVLDLNSRLCTGSFC